MLQPGDRIPAGAVIWSPAGEPTTIGESLAGPGLVLLCFYPFDWSPG